AVADAGLDGDARLQLAQHRVEAQAFAVPLAACRAARVVAVAARLAGDGAPEVRGLILEVLDESARLDLPLGSCKGVRLAEEAFGQPTIEPAVERLLGRQHTAHRSPASRRE